MKEGLMINTWKALQSDRVGRLVKLAVPVCLLVWRLTWYPLGRLWWDWFSINCLYWIYVLSGKGRSAGPFLSLLVMAYLLMLYARGEFAIALAVLG
jgi:hypothetical protein